MEKFVLKKLLYNEAVHLLYLLCVCKKYDNRLIEYNHLQDYDYNLQQVLRRVVASIQKMYDLNPEIIENWMNSAEFQQLFMERDRTIYAQVMNSDNLLLNKTSSFSAGITQAGTWCNNNLVLTRLEHIH